MAELGNGGFPHLQDHRQGLPTHAALVYGGDASYVRQEIVVLSWQYWE